MPVKSSGKKFWALGVLGLPVFRYSPKLLNCVSRASLSFGAYWAFRVEGFGSFGLGHKL